MGQSHFEDQGGRSAYYTAIVGNIGFNATLTPLIPMQGVLFGGVNGGQEVRKSGGKG